jgi:hypothetical protein
VEANRELPARKTVYLGGPIDGTDNSEQEWRWLITDKLTRDNIPFYDPLVANQQTTDPVEIVGRNMNAMAACGIFLFCFPTAGQFGFGSPIEIWLASKDKPVIVFTRSYLPHVYLRYLELMSRVTIVHTLSDAVNAIRDLT